MLRFSRGFMTLGEDNYMTDTGGALGQLEGVSARAILTADRITIQPYAGGKEIVISLQDIPRVVHEWPWQSGATSRPGYVQFVTRDDTVVGGAFALHKGRPNVVEITVAQLPNAIAFVSRLESMLPNRNDRYTPENREPIARSSSPSPTPAPPAFGTTAGATTAQTPSPVPAPRPIWQPATPVAIPSVPTVVTTSSGPELERLGRVSNGHLGTIAAGVALIATFGVFTFWVTFWLSLFASLFKEKIEDYGITYEVTNLTAGHVIFAFIFALVSTYGSWKIARSVIGAD